MDLNFLQYIVPTIIIIGWVIGIVQANKVDGKIPKHLDTVIMGIFTGGFLLYIIGIFNVNINWLTTLGYLLLTTTSIGMTTYYVDKKDRFGVIYFAPYGSWCLIKLLEALQ